MSKLTEEFVLWDSKNKVFLGGSPPQLFDSKKSAGEFLIRVGEKSPGQYDDERYVTVVAVDKWQGVEKTREEKKELKEEAKEAKEAAKEAKAEEASKPAPKVAPKEPVKEPANQTYTAPLKAPYKEPYNWKK